MDNFFAVLLIFRFKIFAFKFGDEPNNDTTYTRNVHITYIHDVNKTKNQHKHWSKKRRKECRATTSALVRLCYTKRCIHYGLCLYTGLYRYDFFSISRSPFFCFLTNPFFLAFFESLNFFVSFNFYVETKTKRMKRRIKKTENNIENAIRCTTI